MLSRRIELCILELKSTNRLPDTARTMTLRVQTMMRCQPSPVGGISLYPVTELVLLLESIILGIDKYITVLLWDTANLKLVDEIGRDCRLDLTVVRFSRLSGLFGLLFAL
jgi:hypothetical protein